MAKKKKDNTLWYVLGGVGGIFVLSKLLAPAKTTEIMQGGGGSGFPLTIPLGGSGEPVKIDLSGLLGVPEKADVTLPRVVPDINILFPGGESAIKTDPDTGLKQVSPTADYEPPPWWLNLFPPATGVYNILELLGLRKKTDPVVAAFGAPSGSYGESDVDHSPTAVNQGEVYYYDVNTNTYMKYDLWTRQNPGQLLPTPLPQEVKGVEFDKSYSPTQHSTPPVPADPYAGSSAGLWNSLYDTGDYENVPEATPNPTVNTPGISDEYLFMSGRWGEASKRAAAQGKTTAEILSGGGS